MIANKKNRSIRGGVFIFVTFVVCYQIMYLFLSVCSLKFRFRICLSFSPLIILFAYYTIKENKMETGNVSYRHNQKTVKRH